MTPERQAFARARPTPAPAHAPRREAPPPAPLHAVTHPPAPPSERSVAKRVVDVLGSIVLLVLAAPIVIVLGLLVFLEDGANPVFRQLRTGRNGRTFAIWKLRTMTVDCPPHEELGQVREDNEHVTRVGRILRRFKLDELPQCLNVLTGEMSLVGPRPMPIEYLRTYSARDRERLAVRPGLTGWGQVNGNVNLDESDRIALDRWYIRHWSPMLDMRILVLTVNVVLFGETVSQRAVEEARKS